MQVFGLPGQIIRNGRAASRLLDAQTLDSEAARRRDAVARWRRAMSDGLSAERAARAVGVPRSTLYRWGKDATPKSRRPFRARPKTWTPELRQAVERLRQDFPMWGRAKLGPLAREQGFAVSDATVGRIIANLVARGVVEPASTLRRRPYARRWTAKRRFAQRLPRNLAVGVPRSNLYRWEKAPEPESRRTKRPRQPQWPPALAEAVEAMRLDNPMWGKRKIAALLRRNGFAASASTVGRILKRLMQRGRVIPVPILRKRPEKRRFRIGQRQRYAQRLAKGRKARAPGEPRPDRHALHQSQARQGDQALHRLRSHRQMDARPCLNRSLSQRRQSPPCQASRRRSLSRQRRPGRRRIRVHGRLRRPLPPQRPRTRRPAAQTARSQRRRRARPVQLAIRVLRLIRPAKPHR